MRRVLTILIRSTAQIFSLNSWQQRGRIGCSAGCLLATERTTDEELKIYSMLSPQRLSYIMIFSKLTRFSKRSFTISFVYQVREQPPGWFPCEVPVRRYFWEHPLLPGLVLRNVDGGWGVISSRARSSQIPQPPSVKQSVMVPRIFRDHFFPVPVPVLFSGTNFSDTGTGT